MGTTTSTINVDLTHGSLRNDSKRLSRSPEKQLPKEQKSCERLKAHNKPEYIVNYRRNRKPTAQKSTSIVKPSKNDNKTMDRTWNNVEPDKSQHKTSTKNSKQRQNTIKDDWISNKSNDSHKVSRDNVQKERKETDEPHGDTSGESNKVIAGTKHITVKGAQLGKFTDIFLRSCDAGHLEIKEYPPVKVTGMVVIEEDKFIVIDELKKLVTFTTSENGEYGKFGSWVEFRCSPRGICLLGQDLFIAFSDRTVKRVKVQDKLCVENSFLMEYKCSGIMAYKENLGVGLENGKIVVVDTNGKPLKTIMLPLRHQKQCIPRSMVETPDGYIMFCDNSSNAVMSIKEDGSVIFMYTGMESPFCAIYDPFGNIIVIGQDKGTGETIQLLTEKGNNVKVLKYRKELGMQPCCIVNIKDSMKIAISGESNKIQFYQIEKCRPRTKRELALQANS